MQIKSIQINTLAYPCKVVGDIKTTPPVVLLHGWPATNAMWDDLASQLHEAGYASIAPPLRGFHEYACPTGKEHYSITKVANDVKLVLDKLGIDQFHLIGHDWGGWVGWLLAQLYPKRILTWTAISVPHIKAFSYAYKNDKKQYKMSFYLRRFQLPWLPEWRLRRKDLSLLREVWKGLSFDLVDKFSRKFEQKAILSASINYYRANYTYLTTGKDPSISYKKIEVPTLYIWGSEDPALSQSAAEKTVEFVSGFYKALKLSGAHWLVQEKPEKILAAILEHLAYKEE